MEGSFNALPKWLKWLIVGSCIFVAGVIGVSYLLFIVYWTWASGDVRDVVLAHFPATVGLPLASVGAFILVTVLQVSAGKIEVKGMGFEFKGASGPVIFWILSFLAIAFGIKILW